METKRNKIGFKFYKEQEEIITSEVSQIEHINVQQQSEEANITPAHKETLGRLFLVQATIKGKNFSKLTEEKKQEFLDEFAWLTELNAQLTKSY